MSENIKFYYEPLGTVPVVGDQVFHISIVYTKADGSQQFLSSGPTVDTGNLPMSQMAQNMSSAVTEAMAGQTTAYGQLQGFGVQNLVGNEAGIVRAKDGTGYQSSTIATGDDLSGAFATMASAYSQVTALNLPYSPTTLNSNSMACTAVTAAGFQANIPLSIFQPGSGTWTPGCSNNLLVPGLNNEKITSSVDGSGNTTTTVTEATSSGVQTDSVSFTTNASTGVASDKVTAYAGGQVQNVATGMVNAAGQETVELSGQGTNFNVSNATVTIDAGANVAITGSNDTVIFAGAGTASVYGVNDNVTLNSNDTLTLPGQSAPGTVEPNENVTVNGGGSGDVINCGSAIGATINVSGATINNTLYSGETEGLTINGSSDHIVSNGIEAIINGTNESVTLAGTNNTLIGGAGSNTILTDGASYRNSCQLIGDDATFGLNGNLYISMYGDANTLNTTGSDLINLTYGQGDILNGIFSGDQVNMSDNTSATIQGSGGMIDILGTGTTVSASYQNVEFTSLTAGALHDNLFGSHDVLSDPGVNGLSALTIEGQYDTGSLDQIITTVDGNDTGDTFTDPGGSFYDNTNTGTWDFGSGVNDTCSDGFDPVILNLKGAAVTTVGLANSAAYFDMENNGAQIHTGWGTAGEGYLVFDPFNSNYVNNEHSLVSSFDELKGLDSNNDGVLNAQDAAWSHLKVWTDTAGTAVFNAASLQTLSALGIASINLHSTHSGRNSNNNTILDDSTFTWNNGTTGNIAGVAFTFDQNTVHTVGGGGGGGGGGTCVQVASLLPGGGTAGAIKAGDRMEIAHESTLAPDVGIATYSERKTASGYRIVTVSGISLVCSDTAPIPTRDGLILAPALMGHDVAVRKDEGGSSLVGWEKVASVIAVGTIEIQHISINDKCFWAGEQKDAFILHHNKMVP